MDVKLSGSYTVEHVHRFPVIEQFLTALGVTKAAIDLAALQSTQAAILRRLEDMATNEEQAQQAVQAVRDIIDRLANQDMRIETAVQGLHGQIDTLVNREVTPETAQALKDAITALGQQAGAFESIEPAPAPTDTTTTQPVVSPTPADTTTTDVPPAPADTTTTVPTDVTPAPADTTTTDVGPAPAPADVVPDVTPTDQNAVVSPEPSPAPDVTPTDTTTP